MFTPMATTASIYMTSQTMNLAVYLVLRYGEKFRALRKTNLKEATNDQIQRPNEDNLSKLLDTGAKVVEILENTEQMVGRLVSKSFYRQELMDVFVLLLIAIT